MKANKITTGIANTLLTLTLFGCVTMDCKLTIKNATKNSLILEDLNELPGSNDYGPEEYDYFLRHAIQPGQNKLICKTLKNGVLKHVKAKNNTLHLVAFNADSLAKFRSFEVMKSKNIKSDYYFSLEQLEKANWTVELK